MDSNRPSIFSAIEARIKWAAKRQALIAENIANSDTPGYRPRDLEELSFSKMLAARPTGNITTTNPNHIMPVGQVSSDFKVVRPKGELDLSGNGVDVEQEAIKMALTRDQHTLATTLYRKYTDMMKLAIGRGGLQ